MTDAKIYEVLAHYETVLQQITSTMIENDDTFKTRKAQLQHALDMIPQMCEFLKDHRRDKVFRWLGFLQGVLYCNGIYTIEEMAGHNRSEPESHWGWTVGDKCYYLNADSEVVGFTTKRVVIVQSGSFPRRCYVDPKTLQRA